MKLYDYLIDLVLPNRCACCNAFIEWNKTICDNCLSEIVLSGDDVCLLCGKTNCVCDTGLHYDACVTGAYYDGVVRDGIINLKLDKGINFAKYFSDVLSDRLKDRKLVNEIDIITSVPTTRERLSERGYNQAQEIAVLISKKINKPFFEKLLIKTDKELVQHSLDYESRKEAVKGAYEYFDSADISEKTILLCDDVITTSSTLNECSLQLKKSGAKKVICVAIATTRLKFDKCKK